MRIKKSFFSYLLSAALLLPFIPSRALAFDSPHADSGVTAPVLSGLPSPYVQGLGFMKGFLAQQESMARIEGRPFDRAATKREMDSACKKDPAEAVWHYDVKALAPPAGKDFAELNKGFLAIAESLKVAADQEHQALSSAPFMNESSTTTSSAFPLGERSPQGYSPSPAP